MKTSMQRALVGSALIALLSANSCEDADTVQPSQATDVGGLSLGVRLADGTEVESVKYVLRLDEDEVRIGAIPVASDGTASATEADLEPRSGYRVELSAQKKVRERCRAVTAPFSVNAGATTTVPVTFQCDEESADSLAR